MTTDEARAIWNEHRHNDLEGWLDIQARVEDGRPLTVRERTAADLLWGEFTRAMERAARPVHRRSHLWQMREQRRLDEGVPDDRR